MRGAGVEQRRRRGAEAALLVGGVEVEHARLAVLARLPQADAHRHAHPEQLRRLDAHRRRPRLVDGQVAVVERLQAEEVEVEVRRRVERRRQAVEVVLEQPRVEPLDRHAALEQRPQRAAVGVAQAADPVAHHVPAERLLVDVAEQDAAGERREVAVALDQRPGVEDDQAAQVRALDARPDRAAQLALDLRGVEPEVEADRRERDPLPQVLAVPGRTRGRRPPAPGSPAGRPASSARRAPARAASRARRGRRCSARPRACARRGRAPPGRCPAPSRSARRRRRATARARPRGPRAPWRAPDRTAARGTPCGRRASIFAVLHGTTSPLRRISRSVPVRRAGRRRDALHDERLGHLVVTGRDQRGLDERREVGGGDRGLREAGQPVDHVPRRRPHDRAPGRRVGLRLAAGARPACSARRRPSRRPARA